MSSVARSRLWEPRSRSRSRSESERRPSSLPRSRSRSAERPRRSLTRWLRERRRSRSRTQSKSRPSERPHRSSGRRSKGRESLPSDEIVSYPPYIIRGRQGRLHPPLGTSDSIRLSYVGKRIRELTRNGRTERFLDCRLCVLCLPTADRFYRYNALSYNWGSADNRHTILCNDQFVDVSSSLYGALSQYRKSNQDKPLWVDALCIDQDNLSERNHQVHLMKDIYKLADLVIAWLGRSTSEIELAFERLASGRLPWERTSIICEREMSDGGVEIVRPGRGQACHARYLQSRVEKGLMQIFSKPWFGRCWIFQEILLAKRAVLWCGLLEMEWSEFVRSCDELEDGSESINTTIYDLCNAVVLSVEICGRDFGREGADHRY